MRVARSWGEFASAQSCSGSAPTLGEISFEQWEKYSEDHMPLDGRTPLTLPQWLATKMRATTRHDGDRGRWRAKFTERLCLTQQSHDLSYQFGTTRIHTPGRINNGSAGRQSSNTLLPPPQCTIAPGRRQRPRDVAFVFERTVSQFVPPVSHHVHAHRHSRLHA